MPPPRFFLAAFCPFSKVEGGTELGGAWGGVKGLVVSVCLMNFELHAKEPRGGNSRRAGNHPDESLNQ